MTISKEAQDLLRPEYEKLLIFFIEGDIKIYGKISESTMDYACNNKMIIPVEFSKYVP